MNRNQEDDSDSIFPPKSHGLNKGKAPIGASFSGQSESDAFGFSEPFSPEESFLEDAAVGLSMVSIGFSDPISPSSAPHLFDLKVEPDIEGASNPMFTSSIGRDGGIMARSSDVESIDVPRPLECLQGQFVPPFLWKTFDLVDDAALDPIVSWGSSGQSFVVWDPAEFSRVILPSNFKHNNFSSFVRQLNTYGFRKIDTDKWEFANEGFQRGKRHLLKNIQRRKSLHSQQQFRSLIGPSTEGEKSGLKDEIVRLQKERSMLIQEVVGLQQQQKGTAQDVDTVNQRLKSAEQRQKQMFSFLAKLLQNPAFLARLPKKNEKEIDSPRVKRKFIKQHQHEMDEFAPPVEGQIVKYEPDWKNLTISSTTPNLNPESMPFQFETASSSDMIASEELALHHGGCIRTTEEPRVEGGTSGGLPQAITSDYFISFTEDFPQFSPSGIESVVKAEELWSTDFDLDAGMSSATNELWSNSVCSEDPFLQVSSELSHIWDFGSLQAGAGGSGVDKWSADEFPFEEPDNQNVSEENDSTNTKS